MLSMLVGVILPVVSKRGWMRRGWVDGNRQLSGPDALQSLEQLRSGGPRAGSGEIDLWES